uniref:Uncharacterized protein n=1 Tax=Anopheles minimus TaxID=112268 RepID=A0A182WE29_9DIPT
MSHPSGPECPRLQLSRDRREPIGRGRVKISETSITIHLRMGKVCDRNEVESFVRRTILSAAVPPSYIYGTPYLGTAGGSTGAGATASGLVPIPATQLSHAAAIAAATSQFYEYQNAVAAAAAAPYPGQYSTGFDAYPYASGASAAGAAAAAAQYMAGPYTYATLPQAGAAAAAAAAAAGAFPGLSPYQNATEVALSDVPNDPYAKKLLQLYYLVQVMRSYHRPAYQEPTTILSNLIDRLTKEELRDELERLLSGVDGFEEVFNIGAYAVRDPIKEQLANDFRLLFPIVVKTLSGLRDSGAESDEMEDTLQSKIRQAFNDFRGLLLSVVQSESEVFNEIEELQGTVARRPMPNDVNLGRSEISPGAVDMVYVTQMPVASDKAVVNDYDLELEEHLQPSTEGTGPLAVLVKDPEMAALIPHIIEQLRMENVTPEEKDALAEIFEELWPLMVAEADRLRTEQ